MLNKKVCRVVFIIATHVKVLFKASSSLVHIVKSINNESNSIVLIAIAAYTLCAIYNQIC